MNPGHNYGLLQFIICFLIALVLHLMALIAASLGFHFEQEKPRTVPVVMISGANSKSQETTSSQSAPTVEKIISTTSDSDFITAPKSKKVSQSRTDSSASPSLSQSYRQRVSEKSLENLFQSSPATGTEDTRQLSTRVASKLSDYQITLRKHMLRGSLYDRFHQYMVANNIKNADYELTLTLFPNGAIKNASIVTSSGVKELDREAITAAFNASPYPAPPASDLRKGFRYEIPFTYLKDEPRPLQ